MLHHVFTLMFTRFIMTYERVLSIESDVPVSFVLIKLYSEVLEDALANDRENTNRVASARIWHQSFGTSSESSIHLREIFFFKSLFVSRGFGRV